MKTFIIYVKKGGLMEDPAFHWERQGFAVAKNAKDAAVWVFRDDTTFDAKRMTLWGWQVGYENKNGGISVLKP